MKLFATVKAFTARLYRAGQKAWLRARLDSYTRHLHAIAAQRQIAEKERVVHDQKLGVLCSPPGEVIKATRIVGTLSAEAVAVVAFDFVPDARQWPIIEIR